MDTRDRTIEGAYSKSTVANIVGWLALILSIIALALAWMAYDNASDDNLSERIQDSLRGTTQMEEQRQDGVNDTTLNGDVMAPGVDDGAMNNDAVTVPEDDAVLPENN